jgi:hypothetical protein
LSFGLGCSKIFIAWDSKFLFVRCGLILINLGVVILDIRDLSENKGLVAMVTILGMRLSVLAHVSFPSQIKVIYRRNKHICLIRGFMLSVEVGSLLWCFVSLRLLVFDGEVGLNLRGFTGNMLRSNLVMLNDFVILDFSSVECFGLLKIIVFFTSTMEALNLMLCH